MLVTETCILNGDLTDAVEVGLLQTMPYMPPELLAQSQLTPKADVYSFGIVMWELLSGQVSQLCLTHSPCLLHSLMANTAGTLVMLCWSNAALVFAAAGASV